MWDSRDDEINRMLVELGLANATRDGARDQGATFPVSDTMDLALGLRFIPGEVTVARREGQNVRFVHDCRCKNCWYWQFEDGSRTYYWERYFHEALAEHNGNKPNEKGDVVAGPCPSCGNTHTHGGHIEANEV